MEFYAVRKNTYYLDRDGYDSFQRVPMSQAEAELVAYEGGGLVQVWEDGEMREYAVPEPQLPRLELVG